jgi:hypothetical protein
MAIWQFDVSFVLRGGPMPWRTEDGHDGPPLPEAVAVDAHAWLLKHFGEPWRMVEGWIVFGHDQGNRFDLLFNEDRSANLSARVDVRSNYGRFVEAVCELASVSKCLLFSAEQWAAIEPSAAELSAAIRCSRAAGYVSNPRSVLGGGHNGG